MADKLTATDSKEITRQSDVISKIPRDNFTNHKNKINELIDEYNTLSTATTNAETTSARQYNTNLKERLDQIRTNQYSVDTGGVVSINGADGQKVDITAGTATINGIQVKWVATTSSTISYTSANTRYDVVVANTDSTLSVVTGSEGADPVLPSVASTQRALWVLLIGTASVALSWDARDQGCYFWDGGFRKYGWKIQNAIDDISSGTIYIGKGTYIEEADLSGTENIELLYDNGALHYRPDDSSYCIKNINTSSTQKNGTKIIGGQLFGNSKTGAIELLKFQYANQFMIDGVYFDPNASSTATNKKYVIDNCQNGFVRAIEDGIEDHSITNSIKINEFDRIDTAGNVGTKRQQVFTSNGTWVKPSTATSVDVFVRAGGGGGGGGGGGYTAGFAGGGGGGGGEGQYFWKFNETVSGNLTITVGSGGSGGAGGAAGTPGAAGSNGSDGGDSTVSGITIIAHGGKGGIAGSAGAVGAGGSAGAGGAGEDTGYDGGAVSVQGTPANGKSILYGAGGIGGDGGAANGGSGGGGGGADGARTAGVGEQQKNANEPGGGGSGGEGGTPGNAGKAGGAGADGVVIIQWFQ
jgi:hypothetical protein